MPIVVSHQPPMELLARAGYYIGAGEERQRMEEMQQRERMQIRGIEANLLSQQMSYQQQMQRDYAGAMYNAQQNQQEFDNRNNMMERQAELQARAAQLRQEDRNDALMARQKAQNDAMDLRQKNSLEWDQHKFFMGQADDVRKGIQESLDDGMGFANEDEQRQYDNLMKQISEIQRNPTIRPLQKSQAIYQLTEQLPIPSKRIPASKEQLEAERVIMDDPNNPGRKVEWIRNRSGAWDVAREPEIPKPEKDTAAQDQEKLKSMRMKQYMDVYKLLTKPGGTGEPDTPPSHEEVVKAIQQMEDYVNQGGSMGSEGTFDPNTGALSLPQ